MKRLNRKGFTLVELLAVVVILLAISVIAVSSISAAIERNKEEQNEAKIEVILSYAKLYYDEHKNSLGENGFITLDLLEKAGYLTDEEKQNADGETLSGVVCYSGKGANFRFEKDGTC